MKIDKDTALAEFERFAEAMDIECETDEMPEDDAREFEKLRGRLVRAIQKGTLTIADEGEPSFALSNGETLVFAEPTGSTLMAKNSKGSDVGMLYRMMGEMTKQPASLFSKMKMAELKVCMAITTLFLA